jgi:hypothetical protein
VAHASAQALAHASPNSRVGKIAAYQAANAVAVVAEDAAKQAAATYQSDLQALKTDNARLAADGAALALKPGDPTRGVTLRSVLRLGSCER